MENNFLVLDITGDIRILFFNGKNLSELPGQERILIFRDGAMLLSDEDNTDAEDKIFSRVNNYWDIIDNLEFFDLYLALLKDYIREVTVKSKSLFVIIPDNMPSEAVLKMIPVFKETHFGSVNILRNIAYQFFLNQYFGGRTGSRKEVINFGDASYNEYISFRTKDFLLEVGIYTDSGFIPLFTNQKGLPLKVIRSFECSESAYYENYSRLVIAGRWNQDEIFMLKSIDLSDIMLDMNSAFDLLFEFNHSINGEITIISRTGTTKKEKFVLPDIIYGVK